MLVVARFTGGKARRGRGAREMGAAWLALWGLQLYVIPCPPFPSPQTDHHCQERFDSAFKSAVIAFLDQWEAELSAADAVATAAERQCAEVEHYSAKVLSLHEAARAQTSKGRSVSSANATRLQRNEAKLEECKSTFGAARDEALTAAHK